jgi:hypothetical protein
MAPDDILAALNGYHTEVAAILGRFTRTSDGIHIDQQDDYRLRSIVTEVVDLLRDHVPGSTQHIRMLANSYNEGVSNWLNSSSYASVELIRGSIGAIITRIERNKSLLAVPMAPIETGPNEGKLLDHLDRIVLRFHAVAVQLRSRYDSRATLDVNDEYDVQDLVHALLWLHFDDVRKEEWVPSYAGSASRTDFLLPQIDTIVEIKKTRTGLNAKTIGEQPIIDIAKYKKHPQCRRLVCFVYDPEGRVANPVGIENDLNTGEHGIEVKVTILPRPIG